MSAPSETFSSINDYYDFDNYVQPTILSQLIDHAGTAEDWNAVLDRLQTHPEEAKVSCADSENDSPWMPLELACFYGAPYVVIKDLLQIFPTAAKIRSVVGKFPLHALFSLDIDRANPVALETVKLLVEANPYAVRDGGEGFFLPVHLACMETSTNSEVLAVLFESYPEGIFSFHERGGTPFYEAKAYGIESQFWTALESSDKITTEVFKRAVDSNPRAVTAALIQSACQHCTSNFEEKIGILLNVNPGTVLEVVENGRRIIHHACDNPHLSDNFIISLMNMYPDGFPLSDNEGNYPNVVPRFRNKLYHQTSILAMYDAQVKGLSLALVYAETSLRKLEDQNATISKNKATIKQLEKELGEKKKKGANSFLFSSIAVGVVLGIILPYFKRA